MITGNSFCKSSCKLKIAFSPTSLILQSGFPVNKGKTQSLLEKVRYESSLFVIHPEFCMKHFTVVKFSVQILEQLQLNIMVLEKLWYCKAPFTQLLWDESIFMAWSSKEFLSTGKQLKPKLTCSYRTNLIRVFTVCFSMCT